jgi:hypothetical protein
MLELFIDILTYGLIGFLGIAWIWSCIYHDEYYTLYTGGFVALSIVIMKWFFHFHRM